MKKWRLFLLSLLASITLICIWTKPVQADQTLTFGVLQDNRPYSVKTDGKWQGFLPSLASQLQKDTGATIKLKGYSSNKALKTALKDKKVDFILGDQENFGKNYQATTSFLHPKNILFTRSDANKKSLERLAKRKVGMLENNQQQALLKELDLKATTFETTDKLVDALNQKKISAAILTEQEYYVYLKDHPQLIKPQADATKEEQGAVLRRVNDPLILSSSFSLITYKNTKVNRLVNNAIKKELADQKLAQLSQKYFSKDLTLK